MSVTVAKSAGFCFGVKKAMETVYQQIERGEGKRIYTFGPLIHNEEVVKVVANMISYAIIRDEYRQYCKSKQK